MMMPFPGTQMATSSMAMTPNGCPIASPMPNTGGRLAPGAYRTADADGQRTTTGRVVAPLRLFDFLPSPTVQAPLQVTQLMPQQQAPGQVPGTTFMAPPPLPPAVPSASVRLQAQVQQHWQQMEPPAHIPTCMGSMAPTPNYAPMAYTTEGYSVDPSLQQVGVQQVQWPQWNATTVQLPSATSCMGSASASATVAGMTMAAAPSSMPMMAAPQMFMAAPMAQPPPGKPS